MHLVTDRLASATASVAGKKSMYILVSLVHKRHRSSTHHTNNISTIDSLQADQNPYSTGTGQAGFKLHEKAVDP
jgi:hypothetical protein